MEELLSRDAVARSLAHLDKGVRQYADIQDRVRREDVSASREFQTRFNAFYRVRQKRSEWYRHFYSLFEAAKARSNVTFSELLKELHARTNTVEGSFTSKMLATLRTEQPVIDSILVRHFRLRRVHGDLANAVAVHDALRERLEDLVASPNGRHAIAAFNARFARYADISPIKKIDLILWKSQ